jgi:hypothetical protein
MLTVCSTAPMHGTAKYASWCSWVFQAKVATRSPWRTPRRRSPAASCSARSASAAKLMRRVPSASAVTTTLSAYVARPCSKMWPTVSGKSDIVLRIC